MKRLIDRYSKEELVKMEQDAVKAHTKKSYQLTQIAKRKKRLEDKITELEAKTVKLENEIRQLASDIWTYDQRLKELNTPDTKP